MTKRRERSIGIRELKARLSECVRDVKSGATIVVTEHGRRVARLVPETRSLDERLERLRSAGAVQWSGRRLRRIKPDVRPLKRKSVAAVLVEDRG